MACLTRDDVVELGQLGEQVVGHVGGRALGDVVEQDREVGGAGDLLVVADDPAAAGPVVVGVDRQQRVGAELGRALGQVDRVARVVGPDAGDDRAAVAHLLARPGAIMPRCSSSVSVDASPVVPQTTRPSEPWSTRWLHQPDGCVLVDASVGVERRHHRRQDRAEVSRHRG